MWKSLRLVTIGLILLFAPLLETKIMIGTKRKAKGKVNHQLHKYQKVQSKAQKNELAMQITVLQAKVQEIVKNALDLQASHYAIASVQEIEKDLLLMNQDKHELEGPLKAKEQKIENSIDQLQLAEPKKKGIRGRAQKLRNSIEKAEQNLDKQMIKMSGKLQLHHMTKKSHGKVTARRNSLTSHGVEDHAEHLDNSELPPPEEEHTAAAA